MKPADQPTRTLPKGWTFFRQWLKNPRTVAAISPSSRQLARQMMHQLPRHTRRVIELGGGTGVFTKALLDHGVAPADLLVLELNEELHRHLQEEFPGALVVCGDASDLAAAGADVVQFDEPCFNIYLDEVEAWGIEALDLTGRRASFTWWNVPPATVYVYQRRTARAMPPRSMR